MSAEYPRILSASAICAWHSFVTVTVMSTGISQRRDGAPAAVGGAGRSTEAAVAFAKSASELLLLLSCLLSSSVPFPY